LAVRAAAGTLAGTAAQACFGLAYFLVAERVGWPLALCCGAAAFSIAAAALQALALPHLALFVLALVALTLALQAMPAQNLRHGVATLPLWDIPARMIVATTL